MNQRDDSSDDAEHDEEPDTDGTGGVTEHNGDDPSPATEESDVLEEDEESDAAETGDEGDDEPDAPNVVDDALGKSKPTADENTNRSGTEGNSDSTDTGTEENGDAGGTEKIDPSEITDSTPTEDEPAVDIAGAESIDESSAADQEASSSAPPKESDEVYCSSCGEVIKADAELCPHCGVRQRGSTSGTEKNSAVAFIASLIIPGAGQAYNEQIGRAIAAFLGSIVIDTIIVVLAVILTLIVIGPLLLLFIPVVHVLIAYDAYNQAEKINRGEVVV